MQGSCLPFSATACRFLIKKERKALECGKAGLPQRPIVNGFLEHGQP
jgi:hypothetical protein